MTGSLVGGGSTATLGGTVTGVTATGDANGGTFTFTIGQELGRLVTENIFAEITTNPVNAGAATYSDVATTSNGNGTGLKLWVVAIKDIKKGEELTCDYGFSYDENFKQFRCKCGSKNCCGYIVRAESRWRINKKFSMSLKNYNRTNK